MYVFMGGAGFVKERNEALGLWVRVEYKVVRLRGGGGGGEREEGREEGRKVRNMSCKESLCLFRNFLVNSDLVFCESRNLKFGSGNLSLRARERERENNFDGAD